MTAGDMAQPSSHRQRTRERLLRGHELRSARQMSRQAVALFLGLTIVWLAVLWMALFGSWPHIYFLILVGTYTVGVLSGTGMSSFVFRRRQGVEPVEDQDAVIDAEVRSVS